MSNRDTHNHHHAKFSLYKSHSFPLSLKRLNEYMILFLILSFAGCMLLTFRFINTGEVKFFYLAWNLFLAWIPFILSIFILKLTLSSMPNRIRLLLTVGLGPLWLLFYPNAPYMLTDFIHFRGIPFYVLQDGYSRFNRELIVWFDFVTNSLFIFIGALLGFLSLYILHLLIRDKYRARIGWLFVIGVLTLSSFGIYLGRFIRWNSWDIVQNFGPLFQSIYETLHTEALLFTLMFSALLVLGYFTLYQLLREHAEYQK